MKKSSFSLLLLMYTISCFSQKADSLTLKWKVLPETHVVPLFTADSRAHRLSLQSPLTDNGFIGSMGGIFPIFSVERNKKTFQFSTASTVYTTLRRWTNRGRLINVDFFVDFFGDLKFSDKWVIRTGVGHTSQHLTDDAIIDLGINAINYTRDYGQLFGVYTHHHNLFRAYAGVTYHTTFKTTSDLGQVFIPQIGFEHNALKWKDHNYFYYAFDIKFRGELDYRTTQNYQAGYKYGIPGKHTFRFALNHSIGLDERGQFYTQNRNFSTLGIFFDF